MRDRTGDLFDATPSSDESKARIRAQLCAGPDTCTWDHQHKAPDGDPSADDSEGTA